jgi:hypothetical protein
LSTGGETALVVLGDRHAWSVGTCRASRQDASLSGDQHAALWEPRR